MRAGEHKRREVAEKQFPIDKKGKVGYGRATKTKQKSAVKEVRGEDPHPRELEKKAGDDDARQENLPGRLKKWEGACL